MSLWNHTSEAIISWGSRSEWHRPTVFEVIAEEILPHVIFGLFIFIFVQMWLIFNQDEEQSQSGGNGDQSNTSVISNISKETIFESKKVRRRKKY